MSTEIEKKITSSLVEGHLQCAVAFDIAREAKVNRKDVGEAADRMKIRVADCQLGFFSKQKATHAGLADKEMDQSLLDEIEASLVDGHLTCPLTFNIAAKLRVTPREVGDGASKQGIMIKSCQLGFFP